MRSSALKLTWVCLTAVLAAACSSPGPGDETPGGEAGTGSATAGAAGSLGLGGSAGTSGSGGTGQAGTTLIGDGGTSGDTECQPSTCETLGKNCGSVADGCGGILECGTCADGSSCGIVTSNVCSVLAELCVPALPEDVCAGKQCGQEGDGCGGFVSCGTCPDGEGCGIQQAFQCAPLLTGSDDACPSLITDCTAEGAECGLIGNGCGGTLDCGGCEAGELCGINAPNLCGTAPTCDPIDAAEACATACGFVSDGCDNVINCTTAGFPCPVGETCGGGGTPFQCGSGGAECQPTEQATACTDKQCGAASDGCEGSFNCGSCGAGEICVSGTCQANACQPADPDVACAGKECGKVGDGCDGEINCGTCGTDEICGLRVAFECGSNVCQPLTEEEACAGKECDIAFDGCGTAPANTFSCGSCASGSFCSLYEPFQCDSPEEEPCVSDDQSCADLGWACGLAINECGEVFDCAEEDRTCNAFQTCEGGTNGTPTACVGTAPEDCPLCTEVPSCSVASPTRISGRVITPGRSDTDTGNQIGVPNAYVYILRENNVAKLPAISTGIPSGGTSCERCDEEDFGPVLASAVSDGTGAFTISGNIPVGQDFLLVTKVGKFRRAVTMQLPESAACGATALATTMPNNPTRLPRSTTDAPTVALRAALNLPHIAISTGQIDAMECVFFKMGVAQSEFGNFGSSARVHLYRGASTGSPSGARIDGSTPHDSTLYGSLSRLQSYDMVVADCEGQTWDGTAFTQRNADGAKVREFVNRGGRMFASHLSFSWLHQNGTTAYSAGNPIATGLGQAATWDTTLYTDTSGTGVISVGRPLASPRIDNFATWMVNESVTTAPNYQFAITDPRSTVTALGSSAEEFVFRSGGSGTGANRVQQFSFNTPYAAPEEASCGRVAYSGFHVAATAGQLSPFASATFPTHCTNATANNGVLTNQEKVLLYMLFDLGACVGDEPEPPACTPDACPSDGTCGTLPDGCGGQLDCGCDDGEACVSGQCIVPDCVPTTCEAEGVVCSSISDGCGGIIPCDCPLCTPLTQEDACEGVTCGTVSDGCSATYLCSECPDGCVPQTACPGNTCGIISDGCDGTLDCGQCESGEVCGAAGPNSCGIPVCEPLECADVNAQCGVIGDGCGEAVDCGQCPPGQACVTVGGVPNQCAGCQPSDCSDAGAECGVIGDGCGGTVNCGVCPGGQVCGALSPNQCDSGSCTPQSQATACAGKQCGKVGDGCGGEIECGTCPAGQLCGINTPFQCGPAPSCTPATCESAGADCGIIGNGCGGQLDCGACTNGATCGAVIANQCLAIH